MKKSAFTIAGLLIATQSFADIGATNGVANSATCDSGALDTDSGGAALEAQYSPETIDLNWYDNNGNLITTNSCTYDNGITLPSNPTRVGYTFKGWRVVFDLRTLDFNIPATGYACRNIEGQQYSYSTSEVLTENGIWMAEFSYGKIYGTAMCSTSVAYPRGTVGTPSDDGGSYCWCQVTKFVPNGSNIVYTTSPHVWVFEEGRDSCQTQCVSYCGYYSLGIEGDNATNFRRGLFGQSGS